MEQLGGGRGLEESPTDPGQGQHAADFPAGVVGQSLRIRGSLGERLVLSLVFQGRVDDFRIVGVGQSGRTEGGLTRSLLVALDQPLAKQEEILRFIAAAPRRRYRVSASSSFPSRAEALASSRKAS